MQDNKEAILYRQTSVHRRAPLIECITDPDFNERTNTDTFSRVKVHQRLTESAMYTALMVLAFAGLHPPDFNPNEFEKPKLSEMRKILRKIVMDYRARGPSVAMRNERGLTGLYVAIKRGGFDENGKSEDDPFLSISADQMLKSLEMELNICPEINILKKKSQSRMRGLQVNFRMSLDPIYQDCC